MEKTTVACIIENNKKELLLQKKTLDYYFYPGGWSFFGGGTESKDLYKEMNREIKEEMGVNLSIKLIFTKEFIINKDKLIVYVFLAKLNDISKIRIGEGAGAAFFGKEELKDLDLHQHTKDILNKYFKKFN